MREAGLPRSRRRSVPCAMTRPPAAPAPGPISMMPVGLAAGCCVSWSTSTTELPSASRSRITAAQAVDVGRVQPDGRLVQHVQHAGGAVAHGAGQLHALPLAGGERRARAVEREVAQPQVDRAARAVCWKDSQMLSRHRAHLLGQRRPARRAPSPIRPSSVISAGLVQVDARASAAARALGRQARAVAHRGRCPACRNRSTRFMPFSSFTLASAFSTV